MDIHCTKTTIELDEQEAEKLGRIALIAQTVCGIAVKDQPARHIGINLNETEFGTCREIAKLRDMAEYLSEKLL